MSVDQSSFTDKLRKGAISGAIAGTAASMLFGESGDTILFGQNIPIPWAIGIANAGSSVLADYSHDYIFPMIPATSKYANLETAALGIGVSGGASAYFLNAENVGSASTLNSFLLGAGSYAAADYVDGKVFGGNRALNYF
jgi:hypothetical protein